MLAQLNPLTGLKELGFAPNEAKVYWALLRLKSAKAAELAEATGLHEPHVYNALRRLAERGIITGSRGQTTVYSALRPDEALSDLLRAEKERVANHAKLVQHLLKEFSRPSSNQHPTPFITVLRTRPGADSLWILDLIQAFQQAESELLFFAKASIEWPHASQQHVRQLERAEHEALKRGVSARCLMQESYLADPQVVEWQLQAARRGEKQRVTREVPMNIEIVDRKVVWFRPLHPEEKDVAYRVNDKAVASIFATAFDYYWERAIDLEEYLARRKNLVRK